MKLSCKEKIGVAAPNKLYCQSQPPFSNICYSIDLKLTFNIFLGSNRKIALENKLRFKPQNELQISFLRLKRQNKPNICQTSNIIIRLKNFHIVILRYFPQNYS